MTVTIGRRELLAALGGAAAWPVAAWAQQPGKVPTIGLLGSGTAAAQSQWTAAFVTRLREVGWTERRNIAIEYRWADGRSERFAEIADEFVRLKVDVIVTHNTLPALAAKQATSRNPDRLRDSRRPRRHRYHSFSRATGWQYHRPFEPAPRCHRQAARTPARSRSRSAPASGLGRCRQSLQRHGHTRG